MNNDDPQKALSPAHLDRDDPSPSAMPRRTEIRDVDDQTPRAFTGSAHQLSQHPLPYTFEGLDRDGLDRSDPAAIRAALDSDKAEILPIWRRQVLMSEDGNQLHRLRRDQLRSSDPVVFLGMRGGTPYFAADISAHEAPETGGRQAQFIDPWMTGPNLDPFLAGVGAYARHLLAWHRSSGFCGRCGSATEPARAGLERRCTESDCEEALFPRINPATIMLVQDPSGERCVMARNHNFPPTIHSILAGYVDAGETLEQTVAREVAEEVGLRIGRVRYAASQPWAFSNSLMIGFFAWSETEALSVNTEELERADWYSRADIEALRGSDSFRLPRRDSIARFMIESWMASKPESI